MIPDKMSPLSDADKQAVIGRYQRRIAKFGVTQASMESGDDQKQRIRHKIHTEVLRGSSPSILDIGCGMGQYYQYLLENDVPCNFFGYDIVPEYIEFCQHKYPQACFGVRNVFEEGIEGKYDSIIMSQVLNNRYNKSDNIIVMAEALRLAFAHTRVSISVDMMSSYVDYYNEDLFYYSPEKIFQIARKITRRVILRHDYRPFEFCVQLFHDDVEGYVP